MIFARAADLKRTGLSGSLAIARDDNEGQEAAPMFLERYDSKRVREWGSANDVI